MGAMSELSIKLQTGERLTKAERKVVKAVTPLSPALILNRWRTAPLPKQQIINHKKES